MNVSRRRLVPVISAFLVFAAAFSVGPSQSAQAAELISIVGSSAKVMPSSGIGPISFPITLATEDELTATVNTLTLGAEGRSAAAVSASIDRVLGRLTLDLTDATQFTIAGDYEVVLSVSSPTGEVQSLSVTLTRQPTALDAGSTVNVVTYVGLFSHLIIPGLGDPFPDVRPTLSMPVGSGGELITLSASQPDRDAGTVVLTASCASQTADTNGEGCRLDSGPQVELIEPIGRDSQLNLGYQLGGFPLGTTSRIVEIRSPQLPAAVEVKFSVTQKLSPLVIILITLAGLLAGVLVRVVLTKAIQWSSRGLRVVNLKSRIAALRRLSPLDTELLADLRTIEDRVKGEVAEVEVSAQEKELKRVVARADRFWRDARLSYKASANSVSWDWVLPPSVKAALEDSGRALDTERVVVDGHVRDELSDAQGDTRGSFESLIQISLSWLSEYRDGLNRLFKASISTDESLKSEIKSAMNAVGTAPKTAGEAVIAVGRAVRQWKRVVDMADEKILARAGDNPGAARDARLALNQPDPALASADAAAPMGELFSSSAPASASEAVEIPLVLPVPLRGASLTAVGAPPRAAARSGRLDKVRLWIRRALFGMVGYLARFARFLLLLVIASVFLYGATVATWVGTFDQVLAIFSTAFALDVGVKAVTTLVAAKGTTPNPSAS